MGDARVACDPLVGGQVGPTRTRSRSPAQASSPASTAPPQEADSQASLTYSFESEQPTTPEPPAEAAKDAKSSYDSSCESSSWERHCQRRQTQIVWEIDSEPAEERELFGSPSDRSDASGDTLPPMSLPLSLESCSDDDVLLRRPMPPMPSSLMAPPPPPPVQLVVSSSAPVLNITFNNCAAASATVHNHHHYG